jgi:outer membrane protein assembly factor BamD
MLNLKRPVGLGFSLHMRVRAVTSLILAIAGMSAACRGGFNLAAYPSTAELYDASLREYQRGHWRNAISGFEKLTNDLGPRDTLLPRSYWYLANAHHHEAEYLLAAQSYGRLYESFPDDSLADDAVIAAAREYRRLWRKPPLDATYGETALGTLNNLLALYPNSEHAESARRELAELEQWFATKNYETGMFYFRQKAWDSAIIYFRYILDRWPNVPRARDALLRLAESYRAIRYGEDYAESCSRLRQTYPGDRDVREVCGPAPATDTTAAPRPGPAR